MAQTDESPPHCLRCRGVRLRTLSMSSQNSAFLECPACRRQYAQVDGRPPTYQWRHPIGLALYGVIFEKEPLPHVQRIAELLGRNRSPDEVAWITEEIEIELKEPTQQVHLILDNAANETKCRQFLKAVVAALRASPAKSR